MTLTPMTIDQRGENESPPSSEHSYSEDRRDVTMSRRIGHIMQNNSAAALHYQRGPCYHGSLILHIPCSKAQGRDKSQSQYLLGRAANRRTLFKRYVYIKIIEQMLRLHKPKRL